MKSSLLICGGIWQCEVTLPPVSDPDFNLQHTHMHSHTQTHTHTTFLWREGRLRENRPPTVLRLKRAEASQISLLQVEETSYAWFCICGTKQCMMSTSHTSDIKSTYACAEGKLGKQIGCTHTHTQYPVVLLRSYFITCIVKNKFRVIDIWRGLFFQKNPFKNVHFYSTQK